MVKVKVHIYRIIDPLYQVYITVSIVKEELTLESWPSKCILVATHIKYNVVDQSYIARVAPRRQAGNTVDQ